MVSAKLLAIAAFLATVAYAQDTPAITLATPSATISDMGSTSSTHRSANTAINSLLSKISAAGSATPTPTGAAKSNDAKYAAMLGGGAVAIGINLFA